METGIVQVGDLVSHGVEGLMWLLGTWSRSGVDEGICLALGDVDFWDEHTQIILHEDSRGSQVSKGEYRHD